MSGVGIQRSVLRDKGAVCAGFGSLASSVVCFGCCFFTGSAACCLVRFPGPFLLLPGACASGCCHDSSAVGLCLPVVVGCVYLAISCDL